MISTLIPAGSLVVSCQALPLEPLFGMQHMSVMARAAKEGGAQAIRSNSPEDIRAIKKETGLPVIGLWKKDYEGSDVYITPTLEDALAVHDAGADIVALDATGRLRPGFLNLEQTITELKRRGIPVMADISTYEEGVLAVEYGADCISTTLAGYTPYSEGPLPRLELVRRLSDKLDVPVIAEGGIWTPEQAGEALAHGAYCVVVGSAITRPQLITERYVSAMAGSRVKEQ